jgi:tetratricopeptide (TPR) repeat protein
MKQAPIVLTALLAFAGAALAGEGATVPITTPSAEARALYLEGRALAEALRANAARPKFEAAVAKDPDFALGHFGRATVAISNQSFLDAVKRAAALAPKASEGERHLILATEAGTRGDVEAQREHLEKLAAAFPKDPRAVAPLAGFRFGRQEYALAADLYKKVTDLDPKYAPVWNQLGYVYRFLGRYDDAEKAFARYVALIPDDPNPYDSQAELFLKVGKFEKSIASYRKALQVDPKFIASFVGIALGQICLGRHDEARAALKELRSVAQNDGDVRTAVFWTTMSWLHQGDLDRALQAFEENLAISGKGGLKTDHAADHVALGQMKLRAGKIDEALRAFAKAVEVANAADVHEDVKDNFRRNDLFFASWASATKGDLVAAKASADAYRKRAAAKGIPFELRRVHELDGLIALGEKDHARAIAELRHANPDDPWIDLLLARAHEGAGNRKEAAEAWKAAAEFNEIGFPISWAFVRNEARKHAKGVPPA